MIIIKCLIWRIRILPILLLSWYDSNVSMMNDKNDDVKNSYMNEDNTTLVKFTTINNDNGYNDYNDYSVDTIITTKTIIRLIKTIIIIVIMKNKR